MKDQPYLNRELDEKFEVIRELLIRIEAQTVKTNGRVTRGEQRQEIVEKQLVQIKTGISLGRWVGSGIWALVLALVGVFGGLLHF